MTPEKLKIISTPKPRLLHEAHVLLDRIANSQPRSYDSIAGRKRLNLILNAIQSNSIPTEEFAA